MGLFEKKYCAVCGGKKGLFGYKLTDGNYLCRKCEQKYWYSTFGATYNRKFATKDLVLEQYNALVEHREANLEELQEFHPTASYRGIVHIDEDALEMIIADQSVVNNKKLLLADNPPVFKMENLVFAIPTFGKDEETKDMNGNVKKIERKVYLVLAFEDPVYDILHLEIGKIVTKSGLFSIKSSMTPEITEMLNKIGTLMDGEVSWLDEEGELTPMANMDTYWRLLVRARNCNFLSSEDVRSCLHKYCGKDRKLMREIQKTYGL